MSEHSTEPQELTDRAARLIAQALTELQSAAQAGAAREELTASRNLLGELAQRFETQLQEDTQQRGLLANQLTNLAGSLDRLVNHLDGLSQLMADLLERLASAPPAGEKPPTEEPRGEPSFQPGGEGVSLSLSAIPGFQTLMDIQKALQSMPAVESASVERFQEGESRILLQLRGPVGASKLADDLREATGHPFAIEEARPELMRLHLKLIAS